MPLLLRLVFAVGVIALGVGVLYIGAGGLSRVAGAVGTSFSGIVDDITATPLPTIAAVISPSTWRRLPRLKTEPK